MPVERVTLTIDGNDYGGWTEVDVTMSMEVAAGSFLVDLTERWPGQDAVRPIRPGSVCVLAASGEKLITGHVDDVDVFYSRTDHSCSVSGRDTAGDLVDCSARSGEWNGVTLDRIVAGIASPFGIQVGVRTSVGQTFDKFRIEEGETAWGAIERACRMRGVLCMSDGLGHILLTRADAQSPVSIIRGGTTGTILSASGHYSEADRYSEYTVKGQSASKDDDSDPSLTAHASAVVRDSAIKRFRPTTIIAEDPGDSMAMQQRAEWEAKVARGRSCTADISVQGWRDARGALWRPNRTVRVECDWLRINDVMLISAVRLRQSESGTVASLSLVHPDTFAEKPFATRSMSDNIGW